jgi:hypothetical protein
MVRTPTWMTTSARYALDSSGARRRRKLPKFHTAIADTK